MAVQDLIKYEWSNDIPFNIDLVKKTIHAMIGEEKPHVLGLLNYNKDQTKWGLTCVRPDINEAFGSFSFGQVNSSFSISVTKIDEGSTKLSISVLNRQGGIHSNQSYLQGECNKFNKALGYYLEHQDEVDDWHVNFKPGAMERSQNTGCALFIPFVLSAGGGLLWLLS